MMLPGTGSVSRSGARMYATNDPSGSGSSMPSPVNPGTRSIMVTKSIDRSRISRPAVSKWMIEDRK